MGTRYFTIYGQLIKFDKAEISMISLISVIGGIQIFLLPQYSPLIIGILSIGVLSQFLPVKYEKKIDEWIFKRLKMRGY